MAKKLQQLFKPYWRGECVCFALCFFNIQADIRSSQREKFRASERPRGTFLFGYACLACGFARLCKTVDRGLLIVCDPRMATMSYGGRLRSALPPMGMLSSEAEALAWLAELAV